ncbi:prohibitin family protein [Bacillus bombysepticus]|uniref:prohibitin family protein n=1 Tax=Bacillus bombysepticus TaxID=658666 RepID=UPI00301661F3
MSTELNVKEKVKSKGKRKIFGMILGLGIAITAFSSFTIIPAGHTGVVVQLGKVQPKVFKEGLHLKIPFIQDIVKMETRVMKMEEDQAASTKDMQTVRTHVAVNYRLNPDTVNKVYKDIGLDYVNRIIDPAVSEALKAVTAEYQSDGLITKREEVSEKVKKELKEKIGKYGVVLEELNIKAFKYSDEFDKSIESKQKAEQDALKAQRDLERIRVEAEQKVAQAEAEAKSLQLKKQEITPQLVDLKKIEVQEKALEVQEKAISKWNGQMPNVTGSATPFFDVSGMVK